MIYLDRAVARIGRRLQEEGRPMTSAELGENPAVLLHGIRTGQLIAVDGHRHVEGDRVVALVCQCDQGPSGSNRATCYPVRVYALPWPGAPT